MQDLFAFNLNPKNQPVEKDTEKIIKSIVLINGEISKAAPAWPLNQINKIDLAILRLAIFELIIEKEHPFKVIVDEAVELAKEFGSQSSPNFVNGVLGNIITAHKIYG